MIVYEYPFNERIRTLLRLEDLYEKFSFFVHQSDPMQHHVAIATIFEMLEVAGRADLKSDLLQELERQKQTLISFKSNPNVQADMLDQVLNDVDRAARRLVLLNADIHRAECRVTHARGDIESRRMQTRVERCSPVVAR